MIAKNNVVFRKLEAKNLADGLSDLFFLILIQRELPAKIGKCGTSLLASIFKIELSHGISGISYISYQNTADSINSENCGRKVNSNTA